MREVGQEHEGWQDVKEYKERRERGNEEEYGPCEKEMLQKVWICDEGCIPWSKN